MNVPPLSGRVKLAQGIEWGIDPPEELEPGILLRGRVHIIYAASGTGKTWLVLWFILRCLERGLKVVLCDAENGRRIVSERLSAIGVDTEHLDDLLHYYPFPNLTLDPQHVASYETLLDELDPALVIFDSLVNFLGSAGLEENSNDDIVKWAMRYTRPARERGVTVVMLDHVPHESGHARGASRKKDEVDVMWALKNPIPFDRDTVGRIVLRREKDREGWLDKRVDFSVGGTADGFVFRRSDGTIEEPDPTDGLTASARKALDVLRDDFGSDGATAEHWRKAAGQATSTFYRARDALISLELVKHEKRRYLPEPGDGSGESNATRASEQETGYSHSLPPHSRGSYGSGVVGVTGALLRMRETGAPIAG